MTILSKPIYRFPAFRQGVVTLLAVAALGASSTTAFAGAAELKALQAELSVPIALATSTDLLNAFRNVVSQTKFSSSKKQGVVAGEALKAAGINAQDAGEVFGAAIVAANGVSGNPLNGIFGDRNAFLPLAAKTAGTGKGLNVLQIPGLSSTLFVNEVGGAFTNAAINAKNKAGAGAIYGGRVRQIVANSSGPVALTEAISLANSALFDKKLRVGSQDMVRYIAAELVNVADTVDFAIGVGNGNSLANSKYAVQIAVGAAAGDPTNAGNIAHGLFGQPLLNDNGTPGAPAAPASQTLKTAAVKGMTKLVKDMAAFADIEEIQKISNAIGQEIKNGTVKLSKAASTVKTLAKAVMDKPSVNSFGQDILRNSATNKQDELVEVAAYMIGGLNGSLELNGMTGSKAKSAANKLFAILTAVSKTKVNTTTGGPGLSSYSADLTGSVALTILNSTIPQEIKQQFQFLLEDPKTAAKIDKNNVSAIQAVVIGVYAPVQDPALIARLENGFNLSGAVSDPETDFRPFNNPPNGQS